MLKKTPDSYMYKYRDIFHEKQKKEDKLEGKERRILSVISLYF
jgi:hypothetical protein